MSYGIKVSNPGKDVKSCGLTDLSFTSEKNLFKIKLNGTFSITIPANEDGPKTQTIYHNLGYEPAVLVFCDVYPNDTTKKNRLPFQGAAGNKRRYCDIYTDRIVIGVIDSWSPTEEPPNYPRTFTGRYYIFLDPLPS